MYNACSLICTHFLPLEIPFLKKPEAWEPGSPPPEVNVGACFLLLRLEHCPEMSDVLILIQVIPYQVIREVMKLGTDQVVIACGL